MLWLTSAAWPLYIGFHTMRFLYPIGLFSLACVYCCLPALGYAAEGLPIGNATPAAGGGQDYTLSLQTLILLT